MDLHTDRRVLDPTAPMAMGVALGAGVALGTVGGKGGLEAASGVSCSRLSRLAAGAPASSRDDVGETPLHLAAAAGRLEAARALLESGAAVDAASGAGYTALHMAAQHGHVALIELLHGAADTKNSRRKPGVIQNLMFEI